MTSSARAAGAGRRAPGTVVTAATVAAVPVAASAVVAALLAPTPLILVVALAAGTVIPGVAAVALVRRDPPVVTLPDRITLGRVGAAGILSTVAVLVLTDAVADRTWAVAALAGAALLLDLIDGAVARRTGAATDAGARLDMEADAALLVVLSALAAPTVGWWVLSIGAMRYLFVAASWARPALRGELTFSQFRRVVAALQGVGLLIALVPIVPPPLATAAAATALLLLVLSFGRDVIALERGAS